MKVLVSMERWPPVFSGAAVRVSRQVERLKARFDFHVLTLGKGKSRDVTRLAVAGSKGLFLPIHLLSLWRKVGRMMRSIQPDIIHVYSFSWLNRVVMSRAGNARTILEMTLLGSDDPLSVLDNGFWSRLSRPWSKSLLRKVDLFVVPCEEYVESYRKAGIDVGKVKVIPRGAVPEIFSTIPFKEKARIRKRLGIAAGKKVLLNVGAIYTRKNQMLILKSLVDQKDVQLILVGEISDKAYHKRLLRFARKKGIDVWFTGAVDNVNEYMVASDLFVFASKAEGFPNVIPEALMSGLPVVTMVLPGLGSMIRDDTGIIAYERDGFIRAVRKAVKAKYSRKAIRGYAKKNLSTDVVDKMHIEMYEGLA